MIQLELEENPKGPHLRQPADPQKKSNNPGGDYWGLSEVDPIQVAYVICIKSHFQPHHWFIPLDVFFVFWWSFVRSFFDGKSPLNVPGHHLGEANPLPSQRNSGSRRPRRPEFQPKKTKVCEGVPFVCCLFGWDPGRIRFREIFWS